MLQTCGKKKQGSGQRWLVLLLSILDMGMLINNNPTLINNNPNWQRKTIHQRRWEGNLFSKLREIKQGRVGKCYYGNENAGDAMAHKC